VKIGTNIECEDVVEAVSERRLTTPGMALQFYSLTQPLCGMTGKRTLIFSTDVGEFISSEN
jgi:predicted membrane GTPase involved in stress response